MIPSYNDSEYGLGLKGARSSQGLAAAGQYIPQYQNEAKDTINKAANILSTATGIAVGTGVMSMGTGFIVAGLIQLAGGILGAMARPKPRLSPAELEYEAKIKFYRNLGRKSASARSIASLFTGKPKESFIGKIGFKDSVDAYKRVPYPVTVGGK